MRKYAKLLAIALLLIAGVTGVLAHNSIQASQVAEQEVREFVEGWINAVKSGNVDELVKRVDDRRFKNEASLREEYEIMAKDNPINEAELVSIKMINKNQAEATVSAVTDDTGTFTITNTVRRDGNSWKMVLVGVDIPAKRK